MGSGTRLGRVRGLGSARSGTHHWIAQRFTAIGNLLLVSWLLASLALLPAHDHAAITGWLTQPIVAVPMMLMIVSVFYHIRLGLQVLIEDYVHDEGLKFATLILLHFFVIGCAAVSLFSVAKIALAGGAL
ncbi:succinate dehydrogenase / fumarate reductase membrane anchor subunit [Sphingobium sp. B2D3A]|uniref:succinate dehydrogenase, hydrophobic membrane anchor protein n=1 Tax=Sphingobium TaxID=165695 RepID=UPI0015ECD069|nr:MULTISPECIES: succinate dehydrogenase, hydrophobic membrane anchor protein [Sphingobium]MCW2337304.1 succinate dehydrogenase / fumarate reductase membrane anchor subunit [Sphingobium sp. B2D3A]MCW2351040.1 succinate dehydrogenase / fumarate reductase membrane anchor subunit [Sphingobium sp. B12D2B]MCW2362503.1 succinate dehydrogenase / fumarate reductase membrane anchor subunit [Sphingobium sp. B10D3B]MCW2365700.1 succinate dehydrogenase / fumarate reductase membrane anchor subunit [Sphingob